MSEELWILPVTSKEYRESLEMLKYMKELEELEKLRQLNRLNIPKRFLEESFSNFQLPPTTHGEP